jgi:hypothetical protein
VTNLRKNIPFRNEENHSTVMPGLVRASTPSATQAAKGVDGPKQVAATWFFGSFFKKEHLHLKNSPIFPSVSARASISEGAV